MAFVTTGLVNGGVTTHYKFSYDDALASPAGPEPARTNAVIAACEADYNSMFGWFGSGLTVTGMSVQVTTQSNGASWSGTSSSSTIELKAQGASYSNNPAYLRYLLIAEVTEIFMMTQNKGWFQGSNEGSKGEGLSRFLSGQFLVANGFLGVGIDADYAVADLWLNSTRQDFVNNAPDDNGYNATNGCTTLFIYYLFHQLGYGIDQIVAAAGATLTAVYKNLTGDPRDPFPLFKRMLDARFPSTSGSAVPGPNFDDPWPLGDVAWSGVWRSGNRPYYLWIHAGQNEFVSKWQTLASQNMRLTDIDVSTVNGRQLWSGIWEDGTDAYYLWFNADQAGFLAKWSQLSAQNLRLVSIKNYNGLYAGVWRAGTDGYYLWVNADDANFLAKWSQLAAQNLRLVDFDVTTVNGQRRWCGVWRTGSDGYYLWINANWSSFIAKWSALAAQGLRLTGIRYYGGLWAGIWRSGTDGYYFWGNANESSFLAKWGGLANHNLRLIDVIATPLGGATGSDVSTAGAHAMGSLFGASELTSGHSRDAVAPQREAGGAGAGGAGAGGGSLIDGPVSGDTSSGGGSFATVSGSDTGEGAGVGGGSVDLPDTSPTQQLGSGEGGGSVVLGSPRSAEATGAGVGGGSVLLPEPDVTAAVVGSGEGGGSVGPGVAEMSIAMSVRESSAAGSGVHLRAPGRSDA
jgi:Polyglycine hydrolase-like, structural repeat